MKDSCTLSIKPHLMQYMIDEFGFLFLAIVCFIGFTMNYPFVSKVCLFISFVTLAFLIYRFFYLASIRYLVTDEQLIFQSGVLTHSTEYLELYRVIDYQQKRTFAQQLFGLKTITILSGDRTMPELEIIGVRYDEDVVGEIRRRVEYNKKKRGVYEITNRF